jgi:hypothetical protein
VDMNPEGGIDNHTSSGSGDIFLQAWDPTGHFSWAATWGGGDEDYVYNGVGVDVSGNVYVTGSYMLSADFDPGAGSDIRNSAGGSYDIFLSKLDSTGNYLWADTFGVDDYDQGNGIAVDNNGYVFAAGFFGGTVDFNPDPESDPHSAAGSIDCFLMKILPDGGW